MIKKKILFLLIILGISILFVSSLQIINFNNGLTSENLTFTVNQNITRNLSIYTNVNITGASLNLSGNSLSNFTSITSSGASYFSCYQSPSTDLFFGQNFTANKNYVKSICISASSSGLFSTGSIRLSLRSAYDGANLVSSQMNLSNPCISLNYSLVVGNTYWLVIDNLKLGDGTDCSNYPVYKSYSLKWLGGSDSTPNIGSFSHYDGVYIFSNVDHNMVINYSNDYSNNPYISINNSQIWNFTGEFNQTNNQTLDFSAVLNSALNNKKCDCSGCSLSGSNCTIPFTFHSDTAGILQYSDIKIDYDSIPFVYLKTPANNSYSSYKNTFICNSSDELQLSNITLYIWNSTGLYNNTEFRNISGTSNSTTFNEINFSRSDTYTWNCLTFNNKSYSIWNSNYTLYVDTENPVTQLLFPNNNKWLDYKDNINFNCSSYGDNLDSNLFYGNFNGTYSLNQTKLSITSGETNTFLLNLSDGSYNWTCGANKTVSSIITMSQYGNYTVNIDTINPEINITSITGSAGSQTISFETNSSDLNLDRCFYTIFNSTNEVDGLNKNVSFVCNSNPQSATVTAYETYNLTVNVYDKANNTNYSTNTFTVSPSGVIIGGGGGGEPSKSSTVCLTANGNVTRFSDLQRCILYARIRESCGGYLDCKINSTSNPIKILSEQTVNLNISELLNWIEKYNNNELEVIKIYDSDIKKYNLFTNIIQIESLKFAANPPILAPFWFIFSEKKFEYYPIRFNRLIKSVNTVKGSYPGLSGNIITNSTVAVSINVSDYSFIANTFVGTLEYTSTENETIFQEVSVRTFNFLNPFTWIIFISIIIIGAVLIIFRKRIANIFKKEERKG